MRGDLPIAFQLLIYPATDQRRNAPSHTTNGQGLLLTSDSITYFHDHYITDPAIDLDWRVSPLLAEDLSKLPPALVLTAGYDPLRDEGAQYAEALTAAGNRATYVCFERQIHGFILMGKVLDEAQHRSRDVRRRAAPRAVAADAAEPLTLPGPAQAAGARRRDFHAPATTMMPGMRIIAQMILSRLSLTNGTLPNR